ncbi:16S rRNA (guanine(966)-N(2))-methyltransferase RsmD [Gloeocapsa sp. PCC 73106]|uniref:16S rRNA (guanine(966)-N(2))-methyltransferase RsmD n=1 Tax=Gloeocapsa sp. PCC 73106 TaxID=102232 RepID=UPI0002ABBB8E|nr:16S rRNA (guanine(966)-N(2))-methyltransferase RsmD [Gloeocapsa sp. PCC 73106]ELR97890.1 RNA methyltransferase, RsmD family [Gloeocapsa sp. PCC 73106]
MRIYGNRQLKTLPGRETRPTTARVREAVFNIWQQNIFGCHWLDICAGNGSMGAEALCRGAELVVGIEQSARACSIIRDNWTKIAQPSQVFQIIKGDARIKLKTLPGNQFDHIYFDPPYDSDLYQPVLNLVVEYNLLSPQGEIAVESDSKSVDDLIIPGLKQIRRKTYGNTALSFYVMARSAG